MSIELENKGKQIVMLGDVAPSRITTFREPNRLKITVKMLVDAASQPRDQGRLVINHSQVYTVQVCGILISVEQNESWTDFKVYDGTGCVDGRIWSRDDEGLTDLSGSTIGRYYVINGTISTNDNRPRLDALTAREVIDHNMLTEHMLSVIHEHLDQETRRSRIALSDGTGAKARLDMDKEGVMWTLSTGDMRENEDGASEDYLMDALKLDRERVRVVLDSLINDGAIYNTIDDQHYKLAI